MNKTLTPRQLEASKEVLIEFAIRMNNWQGLRGTWMEFQACRIAFWFTIMELDLFYPQDMSVWEREYLAGHLIDEFLSGRLERRQQQQLGIMHPSPDRQVRLHLVNADVDRDIMKMVKKSWAAPVCQ